MTSIVRTNERVLHFKGALSSTSGEVQRPSGDVHVIAGAREQLHKALKARPVVPALSVHCGVLPACACMHVSACLCVRVSVSMHAHAADSILLRCALVAKDTPKRQKRGGRGSRREEGGGHSMRGHVCASIFVFPTPVVTT